MANGGNQTVIETKLTGDSTGLVKSVKNAESEIKKFDKQLQDITNHLNNLAKIDLNKLASNIQKVTAVQNITNISTKKGQSAVRGMHGESLVYDTRDQKAAKDAHNLNVQIVKEKKEQLKQEQIKTEKIAKDVQWYENQMWRRQQDSDSRTRSSSAYAEQVAISKMKAPSVMAYNDALAMKHNSLKNYYAMKGQHPEWFVSNRFDPKYQMGAGLMKAGGTLSSSGIIGQVAGSALTIAGSFLKSPAMGVATAFTEATKVIKKFTTEAVRAYSELQSIKTNLSVVYGSQTQADSAFKDISQYAIKSPFGVQQTAELATLLKQSGVEASNLMDTLKMLGDTAGGNMEKMKRIANNYAQIVSIGKASMLDMRQFAYAGIPIFEAVSKELGVSQQQLRKLISDGKVTSDIIEKVFKDLTGINGLFENATQKGAETLKARLQNLQDARQLAMGSIGEQVVNAGSYYGNDSLALNGVTFVENIFQGLNKWANGRNIEKSVTNIENRDKKITELQALIEYAKITGDKDAQKALQKDLEKYIKMSDPEKDRAILAASYDEAAKAWEDAIKEVGLDKIEEELSKSGEYLKVSIGGPGEFEKYVQEQMRSYFGDSDMEIQKSYQELLSVYSNRKGKRNEEIYQYLSTLETTYLAIQNEAKKSYEIAEGYRKMMDSYNQIDEKRRLAAAERTTMNAQSSFIESIDKSSSKTGSVYNNISEIKQLVEKSTENQKKELEAQIQRLESTQFLLKEISAKMDKGYIDLARVSVQQLQEWIDKGAVSAEKLRTNTDNAVEAAESRKIIVSQYGKRFKDVSSLITEYMNSEKISKKDATELYSLWSKLVSNDTKNTDKQFFDIYNTTMKKIEDLMDILSKDNPESLKSLRDAFQQIGVRFTSEVDPETLNAEISKLLSDSYGIPLWKRILAQYTGLEATTITGTNSALTMYRDDMAIRKGMGGVFDAMLKGGADATNVRNLLRTGGIVNQNSLDADNTYQIDWKMTKQAVKDFAMQLSASAEIINSYNKGLEDQYNTYIGLLGTGILQGETAGNKSRTISTKQLEKSLQSYGDQLITAFGEGVTTKDGLKVTWDDKKGFTDENGNKINEEELVLTGNIFDFLEKEIPNIRKELIEGNKVAAQNKVLGNLTGSLGNTALMTALLSQTRSSNFARLSEENKQVYIDALKSNLKLEDSGFNSVDDLLLAYINGDSNASVIVKSAVNDLTNASSALNTFTGLLEQLNENELRNTANQIASDLIGGRQNNYRGNASYRLFGKDILSALGYGDARFEDIAAIMGSRNEGTVKNITRLSYGVQNGSIDTNTLIEELRTAGVDESYISQIEEANGQYQTQIELLKQLAEQYSNVTAEEVKHQLANQAEIKYLQELSDSITNIGYEGAKGTFSSLFETMGSTLSSSATYGEDLAASIKTIGANMVKNLGAEMATAGFRIAGAAAYEQNWPAVAAGLSLAAAGGFASGLGNVASKNQNKDESGKLQSLTDQLKQLLKQARDDAIYYENNMRHQEALGKNKGYSSRSVHDALIDTNGKIITTDPKDYLIATKNPKALVNNTPVVQPNITFKVEDHAGVNIRQEQRYAPDGSMELVAIIENTIGNYIASSKSDESFNVRNMRLGGNSAIR